MKYLEHQTGVVVGGGKHHLVAMTTGSDLTGVCMCCVQPFTYIGNQSKGRNIS
jgi:hypothetical protein